MRKRLKDSEAEMLGFEITSSVKGNPRYYITEKQWQSVQAFRNIKQTDFKTTKKTFDKNGALVGRVEKRQSKELIDIPENHQVKRVSTNVSTGQQWVITEPKKNEVAIEDFDFEGIIKKHINPIKITVEEDENLTNDFDILTYTDAHIGMDTDKFEKSMYAVKWDKEAALESAMVIIKETIKNKNSNLLVIDELGDLLDGYNGFTTRGGHSLPQNLTNEQAFDLAIEFKMLIVDSLVNIYPKLIFNNICNDNHAGSFGYFVNSAFKEIVNIKYPKVVVTNHKRFMNHYFIGRVAFLITHGKDDSSLKFGFKPFLDTKGIEKIDQYCKHNDIYKLSDKVIFKKGDSHQCLFDMCTSDDFYYYNYPAISPSSQWVQTNFKKGRRGFVLEGFKGLQNTIKPIFIK